MPNLTAGMVGAVLTITVVENNAPLSLVAATTKQILITQPAGTVLTKNASFLTDGSDGVLTYTTIAGDLDMDGGTHQMRAYLVITGGITGYSHTENFEVDP